MPNILLLKIIRNRHHQKTLTLLLQPDVTSTKELLDFAEKVGAYCSAKTHIDIISDFDGDKTILPLKDLATKHNFLLMEDRKFGILNTQNCNTEAENTKFRIGQIWSLHTLLQATKV